MKKFLLFALCVLPMLGSGCDDYDDQPLKERIDGLEERIETLERPCQQANTNIASLQTLVGALQGNDYVQSVAPIVQDGKTIGYTITFTKSAPITIYHGTDGKDGAAPVIGVRELDGTYYWTLDGEWLTGPDGEKIRAEGATGNTPQMKIVGDHWWISSDGGKTWTDIGPATGEPGDTLFLDVYETEDEVVFILADHTRIKIPKVRRLAIVLEATECALVADTPVEVGYTLTGANEQTELEVLSSGAVKARITPTDAVSGTVTLLTKDPEAIDEYDKVLILASDGIRTAMAAITFEQGVLRVAEAYEAETAGGEIVVPVETNLAYEVEIEAAAQSWLSQVTTRALRTDNLVFRAEPNGGADRTGTIVLKAGTIERRVCIVQKGGSIVYEIVVPADFSTGDVQKVLCDGRQVAEICSEYIRSGEHDGRMTVVYPVVGGKADLTRGFLPATGASLVWDTATNTCTVGQGTSETALDRCYLTSEGLTAEKPADAATLATTLEADLLVDVRGAESQTYRIVKIGTQYWMAENLRAERYTDGSTITVGTWTSSVSTGYCVYLYDSPGDYKATLGALYNGYALLDEGGLAPRGWTIPDNDAWTAMYTYIGGKTQAVKLKSTDTWTNRPGTNVTGFNAYAGQSFGGNDFVDNSIDTWFWSNTPTTDFGRKAFFYVRMTDTSANIVHTTNSSWSNTIHTVEYGHSIRCIRE